MIYDYDPEVGPDPNLWLTTDESEQEDAVMRYCMANEADLPGVYLHAHIHMAVETQVAMGGEIPVAETLRRLMADGLGRHEAIHAVGWVLSQHMVDAVRNPAEGAELDLQYYERLGKFTVAQWQDESYSESD